MLGGQAQNRWGGHRIAAMGRAIDSRGEGRWAYEEGEVKNGVDRTNWRHEAGSIEPKVKETVGLQCKNSLESGA